MSNKKEIWSTISFSYFLRGKRGNFISRGGKNAASMRGEKQEILAQKIP